MNDAFSALWKLQQATGRSFLSTSGAAPRRKLMVRTAYQHLLDEPAVEVKQPPLPDKAAWFVFRGP